MTTHCRSFSAPLTRPEIRRSFISGFRRLRPAAVLFAAITAGFIGLLTLGPALMELI